MLTIIQFVIALAMLGGTGIIYRQMQYIRYKDPGLNNCSMPGSYYTPLGGDTPSPMPGPSLAEANILLQRFRNEIELFLFKLLFYSAGFQRSFGKGNDSWVGADGMWEYARSKHEPFQGSESA